MFAVKDFYEKIFSAASESAAVVSTVAQESGYVSPSNGKETTATIGETTQPPEDVTRMSSQEFQRHSAFQWIIASMEDDTYSAIHRQLYDVAPLRGVFDIPGNPRLRAELLRLYDKAHAGKPTEKRNA